MAIINQSPAGQDSLVLSGIAPTSFLIATSPNPFRRSRKIVGSPSVTIKASEAIAAELIIAGSSIGKNTSISLVSASGIFSLKDHIAAKRAGVWPNAPMD